MSLRPRIETQHLMSPSGGWTGTVALVPAFPNVRVAVYSAIFGSTANAQLVLQDSAGNPISGEIFALANMSTVINQNDNTDPWFITAPGVGLSINVIAGPVYGDIYYLQVPGNF